MDSNDFYLYSAILFGLVGVYDWKRDNFLVALPCFLIVLLDLLAYFDVIW